MGVYLMGYAESVGVHLIWKLILYSGLAQGILGELQVRSTRKSLTLEVGWYFMGSCRSCSKIRWTVWYRWITLKRSNNTELWCLFDVNPNIFWSKHSSSRWYGTPWRPGDVIVVYSYVYHEYHYEKIPNRASPNNHKSCRGQLLWSF